MDNEDRLSVSNLVPKVETCRHNSLLYLAQLILSVKKVPISENFTLEQKQSVLKKLEAQKNKEKELQENFKLICVSLPMKGRAQLSVVK